MSYIQTADGAMQMDTSTDVFHIIKTMRPMRRLKPDPVQQALIEEILDAGCCAPNSRNSQPYRFLVIRERDSKAWFGARYDAAINKQFAPFVPAADDNSREARNLRTGLAFGKHMKDVPVLLFILGKRDWPMAVLPEARVGLAPPSYASVYPCVQNILLACRARGLGASLTTVHQMFEADLCEHFSIPDTHGVVAVLPIGYPLGNFGPVSRRPSSEFTDFERFGNAVP